MKKTLIMFSALLALLCGLMFTGCQHSYIADEDTWYKTTTSLSLADQDVDIELWFYYSTKSLNANNETYDPGLTIVAIPEIPGIATYAVKNFSSSDDPVEVEDNADILDGTAGSVKIRANGSFMDLLYVKFKSDFKTSATTTLPYVFTNKSYVKVNKISDLSDKFAGKDWKSILKDVVNNIL